MHLKGVFVRRGSFRMQGRRREWEEEEEEEEEEEGEGVGQEERGSYKNLRPSLFIHFTLLPLGFFFSSAAHLSTPQAPGARLVLWGHRWTSV